MSMIVNTNIASMNAQRSLHSSSKELSTAMERLSTGMKINSAADDAAGFAIAENMTAQVRGLNMAVKNANDGLGLIKIIENASNDVTDMLQRIRELAVQAASGTNSTSDRQNLHNEARALVYEIDRVAYSTAYNGANVLDGSFTEKKIQVGYNDGDVIGISVGSISSSSLGIIGGSGSGTTSQEGYDVTPSQESDSVTPPPDEGSSSSGPTTLGNLDASMLGYYYSPAGTEGNYTRLEVDADQIPEDMVDTVLSTGWSEEQNEGAGWGDGNTFTATAVFEFPDFDVEYAVADIQEESSGNFSVYLDGPTGELQDTVPSMYSLDELDASMSINWHDAGESSSPPSDEGSNDSSTGDSSESASSGESSDYASGNTSSENAQGSQLLNSIDLVNDPSNALNIVSAAIGQVGDQKANLGALQNRLDYTVSNLMNVAEFTSAARSRIQDADFAVEAARLAKAQVLQQSGVAMLAQANAAPQLALQLVR